MIDERYTKLQKRRVAGNKSTGFDFLGQVPHVRETVVTQDFLIRFGVPRVVFENLLTLVRQATIEVEPGVNKPRFVDEENNIKNRPKPIRLRDKLAAAFCVMRDGKSFKSSQSECNISRDVQSRFFHNFTDWMANAGLYEQHVYMPRTVEERDAITNTYGRKGMVLAVGSVDGTKIPAERVPREAHFMAKTYSEKGCCYNVGFVWDPNGLVQDVSPVFFGAVNDTVIAEHMRSVRELRENRMFTETTAEIQDLAGNAYTDKGCWLLADCGFRMEFIFQSPCKEARMGDTPIGFFTRKLESNRKDAECGFGMLKREFGMLRNGFMFYGAKKAENAIKSMCILHNMRWRANRWHERGLDDGDYQQSTPSLHGYEMNALDLAQINYWQRDAVQGETTLISYDNANGIAEDAHRKRMFALKRQHLAQNILKMEKDGDLMWLKPRSALYGPELQ